MKKRTKIFISFILSAVVVFSAVFAVQASVVSDEYPDFEFEADLEDTYAVSAYNGTNKDMVIPDYVSGHYVQRVEEKAFYQNSVIKTAHLHDGMTAVRKWGFYGCENLKSVYFSKNMAALWQNAFSYCPNLESALLRNTEITTVYSGCFYSDSALKYVSLPDTLKELGPTAFSRTAVKSVYIPDGCEIIGSRCFAFDENLEAVYVPDSAVTLGNDIFKGSDKVTVYTAEGSEMQTYCEDNGIECKIVKKFPSTILGDVNNDGVFDICDVTVLQREVVGLSGCKNIWNSDYDNNCNIDIIDATIMQKSLVGIDVSK